MIASDSLYNGIDNLYRIDALAVNYNRSLARSIKRYCGNAKAIVDFGAGIGTFSKMLRDQGYNVMCVENDKWLNRGLQEQGFVCHESIAAFPEESLEFVFSLNVLEHIEDDVGVLREIAGRLQKGGILYLFVPAFEILYSSMDRKVGHCRRYTRKRITACLRQAGLEIRYMSYADSLGFAAALWYKWFGNAKGEINPTALWLYDRLVFPISALLDYVLGTVLGKNLAVTAVRTADHKQARLAA